VPPVSPPNVSALLAGRRRILVTGGAGFIGGAVVRRLLQESDALVFNLDKMGYASDLTSIEPLPEAAERHTLLRVDLTNAEATAAAVRQADPDLVMHLAAESHVDRSIEGPGAFIASNVTGTFHLLQAVRAHWEQLPAERQATFRFHHISTDEVFGSLGETGRFSETTPYDPRSPYSASKAASDHLVNAWYHTYGLPVVLTNCSNNYGPLAVPREADPGGDPQGGGGRADPLVWRWPQCARLALFGGPRGCVASGRLPGHSRQGLLRGRPWGTHQQAGGGGDLQGSRCAAAGWRPPQQADHPGRRPPWPRPSLRDRSHPDQQRTWLAAAPQL
jgi:NAD(P)-dependent dehydrogenase (short-subunit alcohol dehydrogenase family)